MVDGCLFLTLMHSKMERDPHSRIPAAILPKKTSVHVFQDMGDAHKREYREAIQRYRRRGSQIHVRS